MTRSFSLTLLSLFALPAAARAAAPAPAKVTYQDQILPVLRNSCLNCHNPDKKKSGLDLSTMAGVMAGSDDRKVVKNGDPDGSPLLRVMTHAEEPFMPKNADKLSDKELALFRAWIAQGMPETSDSKVAVVAAPKNALAAVTVSIGKPSGPPPMPANLPKIASVRPAKPGALVSLAASPWAPLVALGGQRQILLYDTDHLNLLGILPFPEGLPYVLKFSHNGQLLLAGGGQAAKSGKVIGWNVVTGQRVLEVGDEFDSVLAADLIADQSLVVLGGPGKVVKVYNTKDNQLAYPPIKKHTDWVTAAAFSPDGVLLASGDRAGNLYVFEARSGGEFYTLAGHKDAITAVAFRDDSNVLASASQDGTVKLWDLSTGNALSTINAHGGGVLDVAFTHDGRLVTAGRDKTVKTWNATGSQIKTFEAFPDIALHAAYTHDGGRVIAGDWSGQVRVITAADGVKAGELSAVPPADVPLAPPAPAAAVAIKPVAATPAPVVVAPAPAVAAVASAMPVKPVAVASATRPPAPIPAPVVTPPTPPAAPVMSAADRQLAEMKANAQAASSAFAQAKSTAERAEAERIAAVAAHAAALKNAATAAEALTAARAKAEAETAAYKSAGAAARDASPIRRAEAARIALRAEREKAIGEQTRLTEMVAMRQSLTTALTTAADKAKSAAAKYPQDATLTALATSTAANVEKCAAALAQTQKEAAAQAEKVKQAADAYARAKAAALAATTQPAPALPQDVKALATATDKAAAAVGAAQSAVTKATADAEAAAKAVAAKTEAARAATEAAAKAKTVADAATARATKQ